ncbi:peroxiredoxin-like family protein [Bradyrhizobium sp. CB82]|uniref:peroxiredoxin-like family protein n=1 Tax=Bradyrhizobium sp. CB82 TaxID=3039159 RepID=UPI0024B19FC7|nr:peroxiredoxin-like family protein [Bradyrhizobium sp. CB82]WFU39085.1 peroxiredoxin-like family protein [Bradyrhizobium sp. CB82]
MSLQTEMETFKASWLERVGPEVAKLVDDDNAGLQSLADRSLKEGARFPAMTLGNDRGGETDLSALVAEGPLVVVFYRGGWCPYCNLELRAYQGRLAEIEELGARLVAVSPETPDHTSSTVANNTLGFEVLSDAKGGRLADALGIRFELSPAIRELYRKFGHDLPARNGDDIWSLPMPAVYVVEQGGRIAHASVDPDYRKRLDPAIAIAVLNDLKKVRTA